MEKIERWIYGFCFLLGGVFLFIFAGISLIDLLSKYNIYLSKTIFYFILIFFIILMLYGAILILIGILIMSVNIRVKKSVALIIFLIGILIIILSITVIIIDSFTIVNISEIFSGIGLIYLGIRLFFPNEEKKKKEKKILGIVLFIIGLIISLSYGFSIIMTIVSYKLETVLYIIPFFILPFLFGIILLIFGKYLIKITHTTQERKNKAVFSIWMGLFILLITNFSIMSVFYHPYLFIFHTPYFPLLFLFIGIVLILHGFFYNRLHEKEV